MHAIPAEHPFLPILGIHQEINDWPFASVAGSLRRGVSICRVAAMRNRCLRYSSKMMTIDETVLLLSRKFHLKFPPIVVSSLPASIASERSRAYDARDYVSAAANDSRPNSAPQTQANCPPGLHLLGSGRVGLSL